MSQIKGYRYIVSKFWHFSKSATIFSEWPNAYLGVHISITRIPLGGITDVWYIPLPLS